MWMAWSVSKRAPGLQHWPDDTWPRRPFHSVDNVSCSTSRWNLEIFFVLVLMYKCTLKITVDRWRRLCSGNWNCSWKGGDNGASTCFSTEHKSHACLLFFHFFPSFDKRFRAKYTLRLSATINCGRIERIHQLNYQLCRTAAAFLQRQLRFCLWFQTCLALKVGKEHILHLLALVPAEKLSNGEVMYTVKLLFDRLLTLSNHFSPKNNHFLTMSVAYFLCWNSHGRN